MIKIILVSVFLAIIASLGSALYHLVKFKEGSVSNNTAKALTIRISLSILLFIIVFIFVITGVIQPHGIATKIHPQINSVPSSRNP
jgi:NADH:ubiquinone oxidoreductase subunit 4 (subunit M)